MGWGRLIPHEYLSTARREWANLNVLEPDQIMMVLQRNMAALTAEKTGDDGVLRLGYGFGQFGVL